MGRLDRGTDLVKGLRRICAEASIRCGEIRAIGALDTVEICAYQQKARMYGPGRTYQGDLEILCLMGNISEDQGELSVHLHITLGRDTDNGIEVLGGHLISGRVFACEFVIHARDDLILRRSVDKTTGLSLWEDKIEFDIASKSQTPEAGTRGSGSLVENDREPTWQEVLEATLPNDSSADSTEAASASLEPEENDAAGSGKEVDDEASSAEDEPEWVEPQAGDSIDHPSFGRVVVERTEEGEFLQVRLPNGRLVRLKLEVLELRLVGHEKGHQVFEAHIHQK